MLPSDRQVYSDSDESLDNFPRKKTKISNTNGQSFDRNLLIDEGSQNCDDIETDNSFVHKNQNLENNQNVSSGGSDDDDYNVNNYEDSESEDYIIDDDELYDLLEKPYRDKNKPHNEHNKKVVTPDGNTDCESEDYVIDDDELYDLLEKPYREKNKPHNEHNKKVITPDENTDSESEDYVSISGGKFELEKYLTNETNSNTDETDGESIKDVSVDGNDYNNDEERMTRTYKPIGIHNELFDELEKSYRDKNKPHNEHNKKVVTPDDNTDSESEDYVIDDDELYDLLEKPYRDKNKPHNEHNKKVITPDENTDKESEDYVPISGAKFELEKYVTNERNSNTDETDGESIKDVSVGGNDYNNDEERINKTYKPIGIDNELYDELEKSYRDKNKPHNEHNKKVVTPDDNTDSESEDYVIDDDELYDLLEKPYRDKNISHNEHNKKVITPDENTDKESEDYVPISGAKFELEKYVTNERNSNTDETDGESIKDVSVDGNDYNNDEERINKTYTPIGIVNDDLYDSLDNSYRDKNKPYNEHNKKVVTPDENTDSESEDYVPISGGKFELEKYLTNERNSNTDETDGESIKDVSVDGKDYNNDEERMTRTYKPIGIDNELYDELEKSYRDKNKPHNEHNKKVVNPDDYQEYEKTVLEEVCKNHFDILPENWIEAIHKSSMPIYLHKKSRVVTLSRPYFLGPGDPKSHLAPLSAISCLHYQKGLENKEMLKNEPDLHVSKLGDMIIPNTKVETAQENIIKQSLTHVELREYCQSLFRFKVEEVKSPNKTPKEQNIKTEISRATLKNAEERFLLPDSTHLISFPHPAEGRDNRFNRRREWMMNPNGKSYVSILHEYLQQALKTLPWYEFQELKSTETPYSATVMLNDVQYGVGLGYNKKQAKLNAAKATLDILIPEIKNKIDSSIKNQRVPVIFDQIKVTDLRVTEFCAKTSEIKPYEMLLVCLQRNFGECEIGIEYKFYRQRSMLNQLCTMTVNEHTASVPCKNKKDGKQKASQIILGLLHPHIDNWGSLLQLYGNKSIKNATEKKQEQQEITRLQNSAAVNEPNFAILNKLKEEMLKTRDQRKLKETNEMLGLPPTMPAMTGPYTIATPSSSTSPN